MASAFSVLNTRELLDRGWTYERLFLAVAEVDLTIHGPGLPPVPSKVRDLFLRKYEVYPETSQLLLDASGTLCGYVGLVPLTEPAFELLCRGSPSADVLTTDHLAPTGHVGEVSGYVSGIAVTSQARCRESVRLVLQSIPLMLECLADRGVRVRRLGAHVWSPEGKRVSELLGLERVVDDTPDGPFYSACDFRLPSRLLFQRKRALGPIDP